MIVVITETEMLLPIMVTRPNGVKVNYGIIDCLFKEVTPGKPDRWIYLPPLTRDFQNFFIDKVSVQYGTMEVCNLVITPEDITEVWSEDNQRYSRYCRMEDTKDWFYVRGAPDDVEAESHFNIGLNNGESLEEIVKDASNWIIDFNPFDYMIISRDKFNEIYHQLMNDNKAAE